MSPLESCEKKDVSKCVALHGVMPSVTSLTSYEVTMEYLPEQWTVVSANFSSCFCFRSKAINLFSDLESVLPESSALASAIEDGEASTSFWAKQFWD